jgi:nucleoside-diphosphate-sugar epimerase
MDRFLVTGVAGFIGSCTAHRLLSEGKHVTGIDNNTGRDLISMKRLELLTSFSNFKLVDQDITLPFTLESNPFDAVIHLAAKTGVRNSFNEPALHSKVNVTGTVNVLEACVQNKCSKFILASTSSIYGKDPVYPTQESSCSSKPLSVYAATKKAAETISYSYHTLHNIDISILRYFTVYGPWGRPDLSIFRFVQRIFEERPITINGDGDQSRGFTYVDDIVEGTVLATRYLGYECINLGGSDVITINNLIKLIEDVVDKKAIIQYNTAHPADMLANEADVDKANQILNWSPSTGLFTGIINTVNWYVENRDWAKNVITE